MLAHEIAILSLLNVDNADMRDVQSIYDAMRASLSETRALAALNRLLNDAQIYQQDRCGVVFVGITARGLQRLLDHEQTAKRRR